MIEKAKLINAYIKTRPPENDTVSETYRGWVNEKNYIPLSIDEIKNKWEYSLNDNKNQLIDFYIHIPFCYKLCTYCFYYKELVDTKKVEKYLNYLEEYLLDFAPIFKNTKFKSLYIWWGTPTILSDKQIERLLTIINNNFNFLEWADKTFEWNPLSFTNNKIKIISKMWFNRISMWVQSLDENVLKNSNREYQNIKMIKNWISNMLISDINIINIDLIVWLKDDNMEKFSFTLKEIINMWPTEITIYWLWPTDFYVNKYYGWNIDDFYLDLNSKIDKYYNYINNNKEFFWDNLEFNIDKWNWHVWSIKLNKNKNNIKYCYDDFWDWSLFWVWPSSRSHINWELIYKTLEHITLDYLNNKVINVWNYINKSDEISLYVIKEFRDKTFIDNDIFYNKFWVEFEKYFYNELLYLSNDNLIKKKDNRIYLDVEINKKLYYSLFFISSDKLNEKFFTNNNKNTSINIKNSIINLNIKLYNNNDSIESIIYTNYNIDKSNILIYFKLISQINKILIIINRDNKNILTAKKTIENLIKTIFNVY